MKSPAISDKKIFYGLVTLIGLTILLIVGITFIQRPQTTSSDASTGNNEIDPGGMLMPGEPGGSASTPEEPTSVPLPEVERGGNTTDVPDDVVDQPGGATESPAPDQTTTEDETTSEPGPDGSGDSDTSTDIPAGTDVPTDSTSDSSDGTTTTSTTSTQTGDDPVSSGTTSESSADTTTQTTSTGTSSTEISSNNTTTTGSGTTTTAQTYPTPTSTILADSGTSANGTAIGGAANPTTTLVPTAAKQLPVTGTVHVTLLIFAASLMLVILGLAL